MKVIRASNVNSALRRGLRYLREYGVREDSRNGPVIVAPGPVCIEYREPMQHVLFAPLRDANPFFHLFEAMWMLGGRNDVAYPAHYAAQLQLYSDDNETLNGAYGFRWRKHFGYDQLQLIIDELKANPESRRCVLAMWDASDMGAFDQTPAADGAYEGDLKRALAGGKDVPCNTHVYFRTTHNGTRLNMTVCNRSNDAVWGAFGANYVHFGFLMEYVALKTSIVPRNYYQFANNFHVYAGRPDVDRLWGRDEALRDNPYALGTVSNSLSLYGNSGDVDADLAKFLSYRHGEPGSDVPPEFSCPFFNRVVWPMFYAHHVYKTEGPVPALAFLKRKSSYALGEDWIVAGAQWLERRAEKRAAA